MYELSILQRISKGDSAAVADCLNQYSGLVWSLARRFCKNQSDAEDAAQEVFVEIWKHADRFDPAVASETAFIAMLARRRLIDRYRKDQRRPEITIEPADLPTVDDDVSGRMEISDEASKATRLLKELPADQANVIELSIYQGLSHSRIAAATGLSLGTVKTNIRRGLSKLRESLNRSSVNDLSVVKDV
jgi:RNA polymerase sigma-70 factor (ECF subfamily)